MPLYGLTIFLSAFLLFLVQPMIAKIILPWFGGAAAVWVTCLVFFQVALLLGYLYAHVLVARLPPRGGRLLHGALLLASALVLPIAPDAAWKPAGGEEPVLRILVVLAASVGLPYFLLSATTPLAQSWYARTHALSPYRYFAVSNAGSLLGLLSYPLLAEPFLATRTQLLGWSALYGAAALLTLGLAWRPLGSWGREAAAPEEPPPDSVTRLLWLAFPACGTVLLYGVTSQLTQNVAAIPFLWVLPLVAYLLSYVLCFARRSWYTRGIWLRVLAVTLGALAYALAPEFANATLRVLVPLFTAGLFVCCMVCHGELARLKPAPRFLTSYYLTISLGGALGGLYAGVVAPLVYDGYWEFPVALVACAVLVLLALRHDADSPFYQAGGRPAWVGLVVLVLLLAGSLFYVTGETAGVRLRVRNFYGSLRVVETSLPKVRWMEGEKVQDFPAGLSLRKLMHGTIDHGIQYLTDDHRRKPTAYYVEGSGVAVALREAGARGPVRAGVVGLGTGTLAAFGRAGDTYRFYEINPQVTALARSEFTYLRDSPAKIELVPGDARLSMEREPPQDYDVLAVDAFSGDAIPVHLLTREAVELYFRHLKPGGVLALHLSNQHLRLPPVAGRIAAALGKEARVVYSEANDPAGVFRAYWVLLTGRQEFFRVAEVAAVARLIPEASGQPLWTDDYSNLLRVWK